jgi:hypothetical protein
MRFTKITLALLAVVAAAGCGTEDVDSTGVKTKVVYAEMEVTATGNGSSTVKVDLRVGKDSNTYLDLKGDDELVATAAGTSKKLSQSGNSYKTTLPVEAADTEIVIAFNRGDEDTDAPNSSVLLPAPFVLAGVSSGATVSRADGFTVTWEASTANDPMRWTLDGDCMFATSKSISDAGQVAIVTKDFNLHNDKEQETCTATFCVERSRTGAVDAAYEDGMINAVQSRCVSFSSAP